MDKVKVIALYGKSGAGKDTVKRIMLDLLPDANDIIKFTTRPPRDYEVNGKDYYFISQDGFESMIMSDLMLEVTFFNNWLYGSSTLSLKRDKINIGVFDLHGLASILEDNRLEVIPVEIFSTDKILLTRSINRVNGNYREICRRFMADQDDWEKYKSLIELCRDEGFIIPNTYNDEQCLKEEVQFFIQKVYPKNN